MSAGMLRIQELNVQRISSYFKMEEGDHKSLDDPEGYILQKGGCILVALYHGQPAGVCALIEMERIECDFESQKWRFLLLPRAKILAGCWAREH